MKHVLTVLIVLLIAGGVSAQSFVMFSEYVEGSSSNKAVEVYNNTNQEIDLSRVTLKRYNNGATEPGFIGYMTGMLASGDVHVICNTGATAELLALADDTANFEFTFYNGDDVLMLFFDGILVDSIGRLGEDPGTVWGIEPITTGEHTLVRKSTVCIGDTNPDDAYDPADEWDSYDQNDFTHVGSHTTTCAPIPNDPDSWGSIKSLYR